MPALHPVHYPRGPARSRAEQKMFLPQTDVDAIVEHHAVFIEHQAVPALSDRKLGPGIGVDPIQEFHRIGTLDIDFPQCGGIHDTYAAAHRKSSEEHTSELQSLMR